MTWEKCQLIIKHSYGKELFLFLWDEKSRELSIKKIVNRLKKGYYATSYIWGKLLKVKKKTQQIKTQQNKQKNPTQNETNKTTKNKYLPKFISWFLSQAALRYADLF